MPRTLAVGLLAFVLTLPCATDAQVSQSLAAENNALLRRVDDHYNHLTSLRTRYTERYAGMGLNRSEAGTLLLKKPGRMRWQYDVPAGKIFVLDGKYAWFYSPGDAQAQRIPARQMDDLRTPLRFLLGHTQLNKELDSLSIQSDRGSFVVTGVPKGMQTRIKQLSLRVIGSGAITAMRMEELDGAVTEFTFTNMQENVPAKDLDFVFTPPAGVTVVNGTPPI